MRQRNPSTKGSARRIAALFLCLHSSATAADGPPFPPILLGGAGELRVPLEILREERLAIVELEVSGKARKFIVDTGSQFTMVDLDCLGISKNDPRWLKAPGGRGAGEWHGLLVRADLKIGPRRFPEQAVMATDLSPVSRNLGRRIDGVLGQDVLSQFDAVTLDFKEKELVLRGR